MRYHAPLRALVPLLLLSATAPLEANPVGDLWQDLANTIGLNRPDPDQGFTPSSGPLLEVIVVRPDPERPGLRYAVDCSQTKPSQRDAFKTIPWLAPVDCLDDASLREVRTALAGRGRIRPFAEVMNGELRRAMAFQTAPEVRPGARISLDDTAKRVFSLTEQDRVWPAKSPRWLLREGAPGQAGAMQGVDGGRVAGFFDSWVFLMKDWRVEGSPMDAAVVAQWKERRDLWVRHASGKTRGDWDIGAAGWLGLLDAAVPRESGVAALEIPRDPFEDAFLVNDYAKWGPAYKDFGRVPVQQVWPQAPPQP